MKKHKKINKWKSPSGCCYVVVTKSKNYFLLFIYSKKNLLYAGLEETLNLLLAFNFYFSIMHIGLKILISDLTSLRFASDYSKTPYESP